METMMIPIFFNLHSTIHINLRAIIFVALKDQSSRHYMISMGTLKLKTHSDSFKNIMLPAYFVIGGPGVR